MRSAGCNAIARPVLGMTEIIPSAEIMSSYLWDTTLACVCRLSARTAEPTKILPTVGKISIRAVRVRLRLQYNRLINWGLKLLVAWHLTCVRHGLRLLLR